MNEYLEPAPMGADVDLRSFLKQLYESKKQKNPQYSLRAFAKRLGLSHSSLVQILNGSRSISARSFHLILKGLQLPESTEEEVRTSHEKDPAHWKRVRLSHLEILNQWYFDAILELFLVKDFEEDPMWIAKKLGLTSEEVQSALKALVETGQLSQNKNGKLALADRKTSTVGLIKGAHIINEIQIQFLQKQIEAIRKLSPQERSSLGMTIAINPDDLPMARQITFKFMNELHQFLNRGDVERKEVFRLNLGLFPVSQSQPPHTPQSPEVESSEPEISG